MATTISCTETLDLIHCGECGVPFGLTDAFIAQRREDHRNWYCPNGHARYYPAKNRAELLEEKLQSARNSEDFWRAQAKREQQAKDLASHQRDAYKGHNTRLKKRVAKGKCPSCSTSFPDLATHMAEAHPEYAGVEADG